MNCIHGSTKNDEEAKFCKNCGMDMSILPENSSNSNNRIAINALTAFVGFSIFYTLYYVVIVRYIIEPIMRKSGDDYTSVSKVYDFSHWILSSMEFLFILALAIIVKQQSARIILIILAVLRLILLIVSWAQN